MRNIGLDVATFLKDFNADCSRIEGECAAISSSFAELRKELSVAERISLDLEALTNAILNAWLDIWDVARQVDRPLTLVVYDAEFAIDRAYFASQLKSDDIIKTMFAMGAIPGDANVKISIQWDVNPGLGAGTLRVQQSLDRLKVIAAVTLVNGDSLRVLLPFFLSIVSRQMQISPCYVPVVCDNATMPAWARTQVLKALAQALQDPTKFPYKFNPGAPSLSRNPFDGTDLVFSSIFVHDNVSFFVPGARHRPVHPLPGHNGTVSYALALLRNPILQQITNAMANAAKAGSGNWNYLYLDLASGPDFVPSENSVDTIISLKFIHQGGEHPLEYELEIHGRVYVRVRLEMTPGRLWLRPFRSRDNDIDEIFGTHRETGVRINLDLIAGWTGFRDRMKTFSLPLSDIDFQLEYSARGEVRVLADRIALAFFA